MASVPAPERELLDRLERIRILASHAIAVREAIAGSEGVRGALARFTNENVEPGFIPRPPAIANALDSIDSQLAERYGGESRFTRVVELLGLGQLEGDILLAALAPGVRRGYREVLTCLGSEVLPGVHPAAHLVELVADSVDSYEAARSALTDMGALVRNGALRCEGPAASPPLWWAVAPSPGLRDYLLGAAPQMRALDTASALATLVDEPVAARIAALAGRPVAVVLAGDAGCGRTRAAAHLARAAGQGALVAAAGTPLMEAGLEARLRGATLVVSATAARPTADELERLVALGCTLTILASREEPMTAAWVGAGAVKISMERPGFAAQRRAWELALASDGEPGVTADDVELLARSTSLSLAAIEQAAAEALQGGDGGADDHTVGRALRVSRGLTSDRLGRIAKRVSTSLTWDDLVLPDEVRAEVDAVCGAARQVATVYETWGFDRIVPYGRAVSALFTGEPGTGKTMVATLIARELGVEVYRVDLSQMVDKYIGETEKHLAELFAEAERSQCVLLFDEADSLFGKRTKGGESVTERYANLEVNYLLQRIESFTGIAILTTNQESIMDEAFKRRIRYRVEFPFPDEEERERLWRRVVPPRAPMSADIDLVGLSRRFAMTGGHIKNAMLRAAFAAAAAGQPISQAHLEAAGRAELANLGKLVHG